jgi:hypothetical protein
VLVLVVVVAKDPMLEEMVDKLAVVLACLAMAIRAVTDRFTMKAA